MLVPPIKQYSWSISRALLKSRSLIVIAEPGVLDSPWVSEEIRLFRKRGKGTIVPINVDGFLAQELLPVLAGLRDFGWLDESMEALSEGHPSDKVLQGLEKARRRAKVRTVSRALTVGTILILATTTLLALYLKWRSDINLDEALRQTRRSLSRELAAVSVGQLGVDPQLSLRLAQRAVGVTDVDDEGVTDQAHVALQRALAANRLSKLLHESADPVNAGAFSPDGKLIAIASGTKVLLYNTDSGELEAVLPDRSAVVFRVEFSGSGRYLATIDVGSTLTVTDLESAPEPVESAGPVGSHPSGSSTSLREQTFLFGRRSLGERGEIHQQLTGLAFAGTGDKVVVAVAGRAQREIDGQVFPNSRRNTLHILDAAAGNSICSGNTVGFSLSPVAISRSGRFVATGGYDPETRDKDVILVWSGCTVEKIMAGHIGSVRSLDFLEREGKTVLLSSSDDGTLRLWDMSVAEAFGAPAFGHSGSVVDASFGRGGHRVASAGSDNTVRVCSVAKLFARCR
jgi:WD40 repeat protein